MKKKTVTIVLLLACLFALFSCGKKTDATGLWEKAVYTEDASFGEGGKTLTVVVKAEDKSVKFTVRTDKETVGDALLEHDLISGDEGAFGLYVKYVNGIRADYELDGAYWAFYIGGELAMTGVDGAQIAEGTVYSLEYTK